MPNTPPLQGKRFLISIGNANVASMIRRILRDHGAERALECADPAEALEAMRSTEFDLVFIAQRMPMLDGMQFTRLLRHDRKTMNPMCPVVLVADAVDQVVLRQAINSGIDSILKVPFAIGDVVGKATRLFAEPLDYIRTGSGYVGPDRRRRIDPRFKGTERRKSTRYAVINKPEKAQPRPVGDWSAPAAPKPMVVDTAQFSSGTLYLD